MTSAFSQSTGMANTAEVASLKVRPVRSFAIQSPFGTHTPDVVPFHVKTMSWFWRGESEPQSRRVTATQRQHTQRERGVSRGEHTKNGTQYAYARDSSDSRHWDRREPLKHLTRALARAPRPCLISLGEVGQLAVRGLYFGHIGHAQVFSHVAVPGWRAHGLVVGSVVVRVGVVRVTGYGLGAARAQGAKWTVEGGNDRDKGDT